jgi:nucleoid-associated protein YgaU
MGIFAFIKNAGEKLREVSELRVTEAVAMIGQTSLSLELANNAAASAINDYLKKMHLASDNFIITFDAMTATVYVQGLAATQEEKEKVLLCCGNIAGVAHVHFNIGVADLASEPVFYIVGSGDTLIKIARELYGNANAYMKIFEANKPMLSHPDKIYPGQTIRIPI